MDPASRMEQKNISSEEQLSMDNMLLMQSWRQPVGIVVVYALFIYLVPKIMRYRKPFGLKYLIIPYNMLQIFFNFVLFAKMMTHVPKSNWSCTTLDMYTTEEAKEQIEVHHWYFLLKVLDLMDTVFFILRKKSNQITFLHVYHHMGMIAASWISGKFHPGGHAIYLGSVNTFVHFLMYIYYSLSVFYPGKIWWKKYLTMAQIVQHYFIFVSFLLPLLVPNCKMYATQLLYLFLPNNILLIYLFTKFYYNEYVQSKADNKKTH